MPRRRSLAAVFFVFALALPLRAADPEPPAETRNKPRETDPFRLLGGLNESVQGAPEFEGKKDLGDGLMRVYKTANEAPPEKRQSVIEKALDDINYQVQKLDLDKHPDQARQVRNGVAALDNSVGNYDQARRLADQVIEKDENDKDALVNRSNSNFGLNRFDSAYADADKAARLGPQDSDAYTARAMASYGLKNYQQATEDARRALALNPQDKTAFALMKLAEGKAPVMRLDTLQARMAGEVQREYHGMVQQLNQVEERKLKPPELSPARGGESLVKSAASKITVKDYWGALADADKAVAQDPTNHAAYYYRAVAENLLGRYEAAIEDATRALVINPADISSRDARAWAFLRVGRLHDAIADSNHSLEINPKNAYAFANRAYAYEKMGDLTGMLRELKTAAALSPQFEPAYRDAASRHGLEAEPISSDRYAAVKENPVPERERARRKSFLVVLVSSLVGGLLIAAGFLQLMLPEGGLQRARPARPSSTIDASYSIGRAIGMGGMGVVYEASDRALRRKVAIKMIRDEFKADARAKERFLEEARTVAALHHPGIVDIHQVVEDEAGLYLVFEFIEGRTVHDLLDEKKRLSLPEAKAVLKTVCQALDFAHRHGVVHRDLKPANIMITDLGQVKVMDFGISRYAQESVERSRAERATGTPHYMAPEAELGAVRAESDVFSLGACLYEMVTGRRPFPDEDSAPRKAARDYPKPSRVVPTLSSELDAVIDAALDPDPERRIRSAKDFWALLDRVRDPGTVPATPRPA